MFNIFKKEPTKTYTDEEKAILDHELRNLFYKLSSEHILKDPDFQKLLHQLQDMNNGKLTKITFVYPVALL